MLSSPSDQIEYEIYLLRSQAECLLKDIDNKQYSKTFKDNLSELKKLSSVVLTLIAITEKE